MKGFCRLFRFISLLFLVVLQINETISNTIDLDNISTDITADNCQKNHKLDFDVTTESYHYITDEIRYNLCKRQFPGYDSDGVIATEYKQCLGPKYAYPSFFNPCEVVCPFKTDSLLFEYIYIEEEDDRAKCGKFMQYYRDTTRTLRITDTHQECGPDHFCNTFGCCVKRGQTSSTTEKTTTIKSETTPTTETSIQSTTGITSTETTASTTPAVSTHLSSTTSPTAQPTSSTLPPPPLSCSSEGLFKYPNDPTDRKYYKCVLKGPVLKACPFGQIFDESLSHCVYIETTTTEASTTTSSHTESTPTIDWHKYFNCTKEGFFRNPYDCSQFYRCYKNEGDNRHIWLGAFKCPPNQFFDQDKETCDTIANYVGKHGECKTIPMPTVPSHFW